MLLEEDIAEGIMADGVQTTVIVLSKNFQIESWNREAEGLSGFGKSEVLGKELDFLVRLNNNQSVLPELKATQSRERSATCIKASLLRKDSRHLHIIIALVAPVRPEVSEGAWNLLIHDASSYNQTQLKLQENEQMYRKLFEEMRESEDRFRSFADASIDGVTIHDKGICLDVNQAHADIVGSTVEELIGCNAMDFVAPESVEVVLKQMREQRQEPYEIMAQKVDGTKFPVLVIGKEVLYKGKKTRVVIFRDLTEVKKVETEMKKLSGALRQTADSVFITATDGIIEYVNPAFEEITGYSAGEALGKTPCILKSDRHTESFYKNMWDILQKGEVFRDILVNKKKDGSVYYEEKTISPLKNKSNEITHYISSGKDITERMQAQKRLHYLAFHDVLTGLPNKIQFLEELSLSLKDAEDTGHGLSVLFLDCDRFKNINDTLGHSFGDDLLIAVASRLQTQLGPRSFLARFGGDEFGIFMNPMDSIGDIQKEAYGILEVFNQPFQVQEREIYITVSIGISLFPGDGNNTESLLKNADSAMYHAKGQGKNNFQFYTASMNAVALKKLSMETNLRHALELSQFELHYQPQVNLREGRVCGFEGLIRWNKPETGYILPGEFIPLIEETGLMNAVGRWVMGRACQDAAAWRAAGFEDFKVSINVSPTQFSDPGLIEAVNNCLEKFSLPPAYFEIEITESTLLLDEQSTLDTLKTICDMGITLAIDDFGTGYSSLSHLHKFPFHTLKIDRYFIQTMSAKPENVKIVKAIIALAASLNLYIVAEGVENETELGALKALECDAVQGYHFARPMPESEILPFLENYRF